MNPLKQTYIIIKTSFKGWIRYPENVIGTILYVIVILLVGYAFTYRSLSKNVLAYYSVGLFMYLLVGQQNAVYLEFAIWREDILSKPISKDIFVIGNYFGALLTQSLAGIFLLFISYALNPSAFSISFLIVPVIFLGLASAISISYWFASLGLRLQTMGMVSTTVTFIFSVFSGILIPVPLMPYWMRYIAYTIPYTWVIDLTRYTLLGTSCMFSFYNEFIYLLLSTILMFIGGKLFLKYIIYRIKHKKVIVR